MKAIVLMLVGIAVAAAAPVDNAADRDDPSSLEYGNLIEGDIEPLEGAFSGLLSTSNRWPGGVVVYKIDSSLSSTAKSRSLTAMQRITEETKGCIRFRQATSSDGSRFVRIRDRDSGCSATVGYWGRETRVSLSPRCSVGTIMHEFQHTLGVYHQQSRPDRDSYVKIALENVKSGHEHNFSKRSSSQVGTFGLRYDFGSQMHYSEYAFSRNGQKTIVPLPGKVPSGVKIGQRDRMSTNDVALLKAMYKC
ncbi:hypothetical protein BOX15_Mlig010387g1 [Macrostomum lignano]|uniref:Uncharacterized protein n=2 Tax=Macrostomum lignano TaxID=282301 RepID=A0A267ELB5_9PLAT|nr:hypothetical protein BOX15_Mlig010387g1 [Macrostomum lignano]